MAEITKNMVADGYKQGLIRLATLEYAAGIVCVIGDNWFYFDGTDENLAEILTVEEYKKYVSEENIIEYIYDTLEMFSGETDMFGDEYLYYYWYLKENLR